MVAILFSRRCPAAQNRELQRPLDFGRTPPGPLAPLNLSDATMRAIHRKCLDKHVLTLRRGQKGAHDLIVNQRNR